MHSKLAALVLVSVFATAAALGESREPDQPRMILGAPRAEQSATERALIDAIADAKRAGDSAGIERGEAQLAAYYGREITHVEQADVTDEVEIIFHDTGESGGGERWYPGDIRLTDSDRNEWEGELAAAQDGTLFEANIEVDATGGTNLDIYRSLDGGLTWSCFFSLMHPSPTDATVAVGDGTERRLLVAWISEEARVQVLELNLDDYGDYSVTTIFNNVAGLSNPRIITDASEYSAWYGYIIFNLKGLDNWFLATARTTDYAATWEIPHIVGYYCGGAGLYYDADEAHPDIAVGSQMVYIAHDNFPPSCDSTNRDIYVLTSTNFGQTYDDGVQVTDHNDDEFQPSVAAVRGYGAAQTAVVAYTRYYYEADDDVWYVVTQDGGETWSGNHCIECTTGWEWYGSLVASDDRGYLHAGYWDGGYLTYERATYDNPTSWSWQYTLTDEGTLSQWYPIDTTIDPTQTQEDEFCVAWTDVRFLGSYGYDIYYNATALTDPFSAADETVATVARPDLRSEVIPGGGVVLTYVLPVAAKIGLKIVDASGRCVAVLGEDIACAAGEHQATWDGCNSAGRRAHAGIYFARLTSDDQQVCERILTLQ